MEVVKPIKVLVTGGSGFIGSATVQALLHAGYDVVNLDLKPGLFGETHYSVDVTNHEEVLGVFERERPDKVVHLAAHISVPVSVEHPMMDMKQNIGGSLSVFEACRKTGVTRVLFASTAAVYGNNAKPPISEAATVSPCSPYGISKWAVENYLRSFYSRWFTSAIFRYGNVYGPRQSSEGGAVIAKFIHGVVHDGRICVHGDGSQQRDFVFVEDVARANVLGLEHQDPLLLNIGSGTPVSVMELVQILSEMSSSPFEVVREDTRPGDIHSSFYDVTNVKRTLGWTPEVSLAAGLKRLLDRKPLN